jgi:hypothetical protein
MQAAQAFTQDCHVEQLLNLYRQIESAKSARLSGAGPTA